MDSKGVHLNGVASKTVKRCLAWILTLAMIFSGVPLRSYGGVQVLADNVEIKNSDLGDEVVSGPAVYAMRVGEEYVVFERGEWAKQDSVLERTTSWDFVTNTANFSGQSIGVGSTIQEILAKSGTISIKGPDKNNKAQGLSLLLGSIGLPIDEKTESIEITIDITSNNTERYLMIGKEQVWVNSSPSKDTENPVDKNKTFSNNSYTATYDLTDKSILDNGYFVLESRTTGYSGDSGEVKIGHIVLKETKSEEDSGDVPSSLTKTTTFKFTGYSTNQEQNQSCFPYEAGYTEEGMELRESDKSLSGDVFLSGDVAWHSAKYGITPRNGSTIVVGVGKAAVIELEVSYDGSGYEVAASNSYLSGQNVTTTKTGTYKIIALSENEAQTIVLTFNGTVYLAQLKITESVSTLKSVQKLEDIVSEYSADGSSVKEDLPKTVDISVSVGKEEVTLPAEINWEADTSAWNGFDQVSADKGGVITVPGSIVLPYGIESNSISTDISVQVTVTGENTALVSGIDPLEKTSEEFVNGISIADITAALPKNAVLNLSNGTKEEAAIQWEESSVWKYDVSSLKEQKFEIKGVIEIGDYLLANGVSNEVSFSVTVKKTDQEAYPSAGTTNTYNFLIGEVVPKTMDKENRVSDVWSDNLFVHIISNNQLYWHDESHGLAVYNEDRLEVNVAGDAMISFTGCAYGDTASIVPAITTGTITSESGQQFSGLGDGKDGQEVVFSYTGDATKIVFTVKASKEAYLHKLTVKNEVKLDNPDDKRIKVWDFSGVEESDASLYYNQITMDTLKGITTLGTDGLFTENGDLSFGSLALSVLAKDRMYVIGLPNSYSGAKEVAYSDGYRANGYYYANGTGGNSRRCVTISHVNAGDKIVVYGGLSQNGPEDMHFVYLADAALQDDAVTIKPEARDPQIFIAEYSGTYRIYFTASTGKPIFSRVMQIPAVLVEGIVDTATNQCEIGTSYTVQFTNNETGMVTKATVAADGSYQVNLAPGYTYTAVLSGAHGYGFTLASNKVTVKEEEILSGKANVTLVVEEKELVNVSGTWKGFAADYNRISDLKVVLMPTESTMYDSIPLTLQQDLTFSVDIEKGVEYQIEISNVNDYIVSEGGVITAETDMTHDITVALKPMYTVKGTYIDRDKNEFTASGLTHLIFTNLEDDYTYETEAAEDSYQISLRDGSYSIKAVGGSYQTKTHVVVKEGAVTKNLMFNYQKPVVSIPSGVTDIYVGYAGKDCNYETLTEAVAALNEANPDSEEKRITVHIAPGIYREQLKITASYLTFINEEPDKGEVLITGYYGIGHEYYSLDEEGFYDIERAYDKFEKITCSKSWGSTVYLSGGYFRAENIHFENSFNKYVTEEEIEDGAGLPNGALRTLQTDVTTKANTERAAAIVVGGSSKDNCDNCEFYNCSFSSSQDTLFVRRHAYFRDCFIEGNTDYIFGEAGITCVFDGCELSFAGYGGTASSAYITANRSSGNSLGTVFRNCVITNKEGLSHMASYFGRPWDAQSRVTFLNTKLQDADTIKSAGWYSMSSNEPENANYAEWNTISLDGVKLDTSNRVAGTVKDAAFAEAVNVEDLFEGWKPYYYYTYKPLTEESSTVEFSSVPVLSSTGSLENVQIGDSLDVTYSIGKNEAYDTSVIQWVRVSEDGTEEVIKGYSALQTGHSYKITELDQGCTIKVVVKPETISGYQGTEAFASVTVGVVSSDKGLRKYVQEGYASAYNQNGVSGGGIQTEGTSTYYQVATAEEFLKALQAVKSSGKASVIELTQDIELGSNEVANFGSYSSMIKAYAAAPLTHPTLLETGVSTLSFSDIHDLTIFSLDGFSIKHANITMKNAENIIIRNIKFDELWEWDEATKGDYDRNDWDYMTIDTNCNGIWIDHCTFFKAYDGVIDVKNPSPEANITISWCEFLPGSEGDSFFKVMMDELAANPEKYPTYQHMLEEGMTTDQVYMYAYGQKKTHLFGQSDEATNAAGIKVTLANNYYKNSMDRMPRLRYGYTHVYNCIMDAQDLLTAKDGIANAEIAKKIVSNGASSTCGAQILLENCYINGIQNALNSGNGSSKPGYINAINSVYYMNGEKTELVPKNNSTNEDQSVLITDETTFKSGLPYNQYILYHAGKLDTLVKPYAGAGKLELTVLQWEKASYNDDTMPDTGEEEEPTPEETTPEETTPEETTPEETTPEETTPEETTPSRPTQDDSDDDDDDDYEEQETSLTKREEDLVADVVGTSSVKDVTENNSGKLVVTVNNEVVFFEKNGTLSKDKWQQVEGSWYFFGTDSKAVGGWLERDGKWYHLNEVNKKMETGWLQTADKKWYLLDSKNGDMKTGWQQTANGKWYLLDSKNGDMKTGWQQTADGKWYLLDSKNGDMKTGWQQTADGKWYLLDSKNGDMKTGWQQTADGKWYLLDSKNGDMKTGWQMVKGFWYYLTKTGSMAEDTITPDGYKVGKDGAWTGEKVR